MCSTVPIVGTKLVVVDRLVASATAKLAFVAKDAAVTKGTATDVDGIGVTLEVSYDSAAGRFTVPAGAHDGTSGWLVNKDTVAKFVHPGAPTGATQAKVVVIKPGVLAKLVGKGLGDEPLDVSGPPTGPVTVVLGVSNGGEEFRHCTAFAACSHASIAAGTGAKLVCKNGAAVSCPTP